MLPIQSSEEGFTLQELSKETGTAFISCELPLNYGMIYVNEETEESCLGTVIAGKQPFTIPSGAKKLIFRHHSIDTSKPLETVETLDLQPLLE